MAQCPELSAIQEGSKELPPGKCRLCLGPRPKGEEHSKTCFEYIHKPTKKLKSFLCSKEGHPKCHYKICRPCGKERKAQGTTVSLNTQWRGGRAGP